MSVSGAKTAVILAVAIGAGVAGISFGLDMLEGPAGQESASRGVLQQETGSGETADIPASRVDKSGFKMAPDLVGIAGYINTSPEMLQGAIKDKVVLYDIWTYSCVNCIRTLPYITAWDEKYSEQGLLVIGIHSPEFEFEKNRDNVQRAVEKYNINYPVVLDNDMETWSAFENRYWPRKYIADHEGYIRYDHIGEGGYKESELVIQDLLMERASALGTIPQVSAETVDIAAFEHTGRTTPEIYFGYKLALPGRNYIANEEGFRPESTVTYADAGNFIANKFYMTGTWFNGIDSMRMLSDTGDVLLKYYAREVNIVASGSANLQITLDGIPVPSEHAGSDVKNGILGTDEPQLYNVIDSPKAGVHELRISSDSTGFEIFTFTFG